VQANAADEAMMPVAGPLKAGLDDLQAASMWLMQHGFANPDNAGAASVDYLHLFGLVSLGYMWGLQARAAADRLKSGPDAAMTMKLTLARFYMERLMPETASRLAALKAGSATMMAVPAEMF